MDKSVNDSDGMLGFHILKVLVENELLHRLVSADGEEDACHFDVDSIFANVERRDTSYAVNARLKDVASAVSQ